VEWDWGCGGVEKVLDTWGHHSWRQGEIGRVARGRGMRVRVVKASVRVVIVICRVREFRTVIGRGGAELHGLFRKRTLMPSGGMGMEIKSRFLVMNVVAAVVERGWTTPTLAHPRIHAPKGVVRLNHDNIRHFILRYDNHFLFQPIEEAVPGQDG